MYIVFRYLVLQLGFFFFLENSHVFSQDNETVFVITSKFTEILLTFVYFVFKISSFFSLQFIELRHKIYFKRNVA